MHICFLGWRVVVGWLLMQPTTILTLKPKRQKKKVMNLTLVRRRSICQKTCNIKFLFVFFFTLLSLVVFSSSNCLIPIRIAFYP